MILSNNTAKNERGAGGGRFTKTVQNATVREVTGIREGLGAERRKEEKDTEKY